MKNTPLLPRPWPSPLRRRWFAEFQMQLDVAKFFFAHDVAFGGNHRAVHDFPRRGIALLVGPFGKVFAVKQDDRVARRRGIFAERGAGRHDGRLRARRIVNVPFAVRLHRRVLKTSHAVNRHFDVFGLGGSGLLILGRLRLFDRLRLRRFLLRGTAGERDGQGEGEEKDFFHFVFGAKRTVVECKSNSSFWKFRPLAVGRGGLDAGFDERDAGPAVLDVGVFAAVAIEFFAGLPFAHVGLETAVQPRESVVKRFGMAGWESSARPSSRRAVPWAGNRRRASPRRANKRGPAGSADGS